MDKGKAYYEMRWMILPAETCSSVQLWVSASNVYTCIWCNTRTCSRSCVCCLVAVVAHFHRALVLMWLSAATNLDKLRRFSRCFFAPQTLIIECRPGLWVNSYTDTSPRLAFTLTARQRLGGQNEFKQLFLNVWGLCKHTMLFVVQLSCCGYVLAACSQKGVQNGRQFSLFAGWRSTEAKLWKTSR